MRKLTKIYIIFTLFIFIFPSLAFARDNIIILHNETKSFNISKSISIFEDETAAISFPEILSEKYRNLFKINNEQIPSFGFTDSAFWVRFSIKSNSQIKREWFLELDYPLMDSFELYELYNNSYEKKVYGSGMPYSKRDLKHRNIVIKLILEPGQEKQYYVQFKNEDRVEFPMTIWSPSSFFENMYKEQFILGLYYGILFVMFMYNLFLFISVKEVPYLYYIIYIFTMSLFQLVQNGYFYQLLSYFMEIHPVHFIPTTQALVILAILQFSQSFLITKIHSKFFHTVMNILKSVTFLYLFCPIILSYTVSILIGTGITFLIIPVVMASGFTVIRKGYRPAYYFMGAWSVMFIAGLLFLLRILAIIPNNIFTNYILHIGTTIEVIVLSLGLGDRYNLIKEERERISSELKIAKEIQTSLVPEQLPQINEISSNAIYIPMDDVGGDLFDYFAIDDKSFGVLVADVSGHGIPAAMVASMVKIAFSQQLNYAQEPSKVLMGMADILQKQVQDTFITASYTYFDLEKMKLKTSKCGHLPLYVFKDSGDELIQLNSKGILIGKLPIAEITQTEMDLNSKDKIIILTDGIIECRDKNGIIYGFEKFEDYIKSNKSLEAEIFSENLIKSLYEWCKPASSFNDDITLLVIDIL